MSELSPCCGCARHVRTDAVMCPFCGERVRAQSVRRRVARGATRAAIFYVGATLAGCDDPATATIYGGPPEPPPQETIAQPYGAPPDPPPPPPPEPTQPEPSEGPEVTVDPEDPEAAAPGLGRDVSAGSMGQPYGAAPSAPVRQ